MAEKMPERITAFSVSPLKSGGYWSTAPQPPMEAISDYIRADLVDDAVKALEEARESVEVWSDIASDATHFRHDVSDDLAKIDAALNRIKEK